MEFTLTTFAFIAMIVAGIAFAAFGKWRMNNTIMIVGGLIVLAGLYCIINAWMMTAQ